MQHNVSHKAEEKQMLQDTNLKLCIQPKQENVCFNYKRVIICITWKKIVRFFIVG